MFSAADFEDFREPRPDMPPEMEAELEAVVRILVQNRWPWRLHATYDETISRALDVVRAREPRHAARRACTGSSTTRRRSRSGPSIGSRRWAAASPCSTAWPTRANTSSSATAHARRKPHRRSRACWRRASRSPPAPMRRGLRPTIRGCRSRGWSPVARWAACASTRSATAWTARQRCAYGPRTRPGSPTKRARRDGSRPASSPT